MITIIRADVNDSLSLTDIAIRSEAYWGYDNEFMKNFKALYSVSEDFIAKNPTYIIKDKDILVGFYGLLIEVAEISLEYLFIDPLYIGKGYGKMLWDHLLNECRTMNITSFTLVTSPQAKDFYIKLGALLCDEVDSLVIKGKKIPKLLYLL